MAFFRMRRAALLMHATPISINDFVWMIMNVRIEDVCFHCSKRLEINLESNKFAQSPNVRMLEYFIVVRVRARVYLFRILHNITYANRCSSAMPRIYLEH